MVINKSEVKTTSQNVLIIGFVWPEPNSSAAGGRMMQLIELFRAQGWTLTFASTAAYSEHAFDLQVLGVTQVNIALNDASFDAFIKQLQPTIVLFDRFMVEEQFGWRVAKQCPNAIRILDTEDLHCLRAARQQAFKENRPFKKEDLLLDVAKREIAAILRSDLSLIISSIEMELLQSFFKVDEALLHHVPFMLDEIRGEDKNIWIEFAKREHFITIGNFLHEPNWNAVQYLYEEIWPLIRKQLPDTQLHVYGAYPTQKVYALHKPEKGFLIMGRAEDAKTMVSHARVCLAPLRFGAGLKGKLVEAMQCGTPSVTTTIGAEGMHGELPWSGSIADTAQQIAEAAVQLYANEKAWQQAQQHGISIINTCYNKNELGETLINRINKLGEQLEKHRQANFTGAMLMHHTMASTHYMSKWIEAKNKLAKE